MNIYELYYSWFNYIWLTLFIFIFAHTDCVSGIMAKYRNNERMRRFKMKQYIEFATGGSSIPHLHITGHPSETISLSWGWYYAVAQLVVGVYLWDPTPSLWLSGLNHRAAGRSGGHVNSGGTQCLVSSCTPWMGLENPGIIKLSFTLTIWEFHFIYIYIVLEIPWVSD